MPFCISDLPVRGETEINMYFIYLRSIDKKVKVSKEVYDAFYKEAHRIRSKEQYHGRCVCPKKELWKCDGICEECRYRVYKDIYLDTPLKDDIHTIGDTTETHLPTPEEIIADRDLLRRLIKRFRDLDDRADEIISIYIDHPEGISDRKVAEILGRPASTHQERMKKIRHELRKFRSK